VGETTVNAKISIGQLENGGFGLSGELSVNVPEFQQQAQEFVDKAHQVLLERNPREYRNKINSN
jgi:organic hydroperoxide reductase OsmC/OhrA